MQMNVVAWGFSILSIALPLYVLSRARGTGRGRCSLGGVGRHPFLSHGVKSESKQKEWAEGSFFFCSHQIRASLRDRRSQVGCLLQAHGASRMGIENITSGSGGRAVSDGRTHRRSLRISRSRQTTGAVVMGYMGPGPSNGQELKKMAACPAERATISSSFYFFRFSPSSPRAATAAAAVCCP